MSKAPVQVSIAKPCSQDWNAMQPGSTGVRHCDHCQKAVTDFTGMTDRQLLSYIERNGLGCGRFRKDQLSRELSGAEARRLPAWGKALAAGLGLLLSFHQKAAAAVKKPAPVNTVDGADRQPQSPMPDSVQISGFVSDPGGEGLIGWPVHLYHKGVTFDSVYTNDEGNFTTGKIPVAWLNGDLKVRAEYSGMIREQTVTDYSTVVKLLFVSVDKSRLHIVGGYRAVSTRPARRKSFFRKLQFWRRKKQPSSHVLGGASRF